MDFKFNAMRFRIQLATTNQRAILSTNFPLLYEIMLKYHGVRCDSAVLIIFQMLSACVTCICFFFLALNFAMFLKPMKKEITLIFRKVDLFSLTNFLTQHVTAFLSLKYF